jgi:hypothetical protein
VVGVEAGFTIGQGALVEVAGTIQVALLVPERVKVIEPSWGCTGLEWSCYSQGWCWSAGQVPTESSQAAIQVGGGAEGSC